MNPRYLLVLLACVLVGCGTKGGEGSRWVPAEAELSLVAPSIAELRDQLEVFLAGIEGASGLIDLTEARVGLDLRSRAGLQASGIDPDTSLSLFMHQGALCVAFGVSDVEAFDARMKRQISRYGEGRLDAVQEDSGLLGSFRSKEVDAPWSLAWGKGSDHVGLVLWQMAELDAQERWRALAQGPHDNLTRLEQAKEALGAESGLHITMRGAPSPPSHWQLGPLNMLLAPLTGGLNSWEGTWVFGATRTAFKLDGAWGGDGELASDWFQPAGEHIELTRSIPKSQTLTLRARLNPRKVLAIPSFIRNRFLPKRVPGPLSMLLPPTEELLGLLNGDIALTLLGIDESATLEDALGPVDAAKLLQFIHAGVLVGVTDADAARVAVAAARHHLKERGWFPAPLEAGGWQGVALRDKERSALWSILYRGNQVAILSGGGEVARMIQVAEGQALSLAASAESEVEKAAVSSEDLAFGLSASFRRVTRELASKGAPPYFLKMVNDIRSLSGALSATKKGVSLSLEVRL